MTAPDPLIELLDQWDRNAYNREPSPDNHLLALHIYGWLQRLRKPESYACPECPAGQGQHCLGVLGSHLRRAELMQKTFYEVIGLKGWGQRWTTSMPS